MVSLINSARIPSRAMRTSEEYLKRQTFKVENAAVLALLVLYREAYRDITSYLQDTASITASWRNPVEAYVVARTARLKTDTLALVDRWTKAALVGNYYGRLWLLDMATPERIQVHTPPLSRVSLREDIYDQLIQDLLGQEWRDQYALELDDLTLSIRRAIGIGIRDKESMSAIQRRVRDAMGVITDRRRGALGSSDRAGYRANFNRVQTLTRTVVQTVANNGSMTAYRANADLIDGYEWLTAHDERTCPICRPLDRKRFGLKSNFRPPIHPQCRCTTVPVLKGQMEVEADAAPRQSLPDWVLRFGIQRELTDFLEP